MLHFAVLGAALLAFHHWRAPAAPGKRIVVSEATIQGLRLDHVRRYGAVPTAAEEAAIIDRFIDEEVKVREALSLGLDRGDVIVRRRLIQKMDFLTEDAEPVPDPDDGQLEAYLRAHADRYATPDRVSLIQVFASTERQGKASEAVAAQLRERLLAGSDPATLGDPFLRGREFRAQSEREIAAMFGAEFAAKVMSLPLGSWSGPIRSSYGHHVVRLEERNVGSGPALAQVRDALRRDWRQEQREMQNRAALERLRAGYEIRIEADQPARQDSLAVLR